MSRTKNLLLCAAAVIMAAVLGLVADDIETAHQARPDGTLAPLVPVPFGWGGAVFATTLVAGMFAIAQLVGYKRKRFWLTLVLLAAYVSLKAMAWQRAYNAAMAALAPVLPDGSGVVASSQDSIDTLSILSSILGALCIVSVFVTLRRIVLLRGATRGKRRRRSHHGEAPESGAEDEDDLLDASVDEDSSERTGEEPEAEMILPDAPADEIPVIDVFPTPLLPPEPPPTEAPTPATPESPEPTTKPKRITRLFE
jgi:hypothetical protein